MDNSGTNIVWQIILIIILTALNAFFAAAEMAIVSVDKKRISKLAKEGNKKSQMLLNLLIEPSKFLSTIQVGITLAGLFSSASAAVGISEKLGGALTRVGVPFGQDIAFIGITILLSYIILVFGELVPKRIALQKSERFAMFAIKPIIMLSKIAGPFISLLSFSTNTVLSILGFRSDSVEEKVTLEEIRSLVETGQEQGVINPIEREMIDSVISFDDKSCEEIMTARTEVFMIDAEEPINEQLEAIMELNYSRIPVYEGDVDNIIGILYLKDFLLEAYRVGFENVDIKKILRPAYFVPEYKSINDLFLEMQSQRQHMAVLIDEYGGFSGIVTMEDLVEEIMGDIEDEYDTDEPEIKKIDENNYYVSGSMAIEDLNEALHIGLDEDSDEYETLGGLLIYLLGHIPNDDEQISIKHKDVIFHIEEVKERRIQLVRVELKKENGKEQ
jgi:putative hemolysin